MAITHVTPAVGNSPSRRQANNGNEITLTYGNLQADDLLLFSFGVKGGDGAVTGPAITGGTSSFTQFDLLNTDWLHNYADTDAYTSAQGNSYCGVYWVKVQSGDLTSSEIEVTATPTANHTHSVLVAIRGIDWSSFNSGTPNMAKMSIDSSRESYSGSTNRDFTWADSNGIPGTSSDPWNSTFYDSSLSVIAFGICDRGNWRDANFPATWDSLNFASGTTNTDNSLQGNGQNTLWLKRDFASYAAADAATADAMGEPLELPDSSSTTSVMAQYTLWLALKEASSTVVNITAALSASSAVATTLTVTGDQVSLTSSMSATSDIGTATLTVTGDQQTVTAALTGGSAIATTLTVTGDQETLTATLTGASAVATTLTVTSDQETVTASLTGASGVATTLTVTSDEETLTAALVGGSTVATTLTVTGEQETLTASLTGGSAVATTLTIANEEEISASLTGTSAISTATLTVADADVAVTAGLTGSAAITTATLTVTSDEETLTAALVGASSITTTLTIAGDQEALTAALSGSSAVVSSLTVTGDQETLTAALSGASGVTTTLTVTGDQEALTAALAGASVVTSTLTVTGDQETLTANLSGSSAVTTSLSVTAAIVNITASLEGSSVVEATITGEKTIDDVYDLAVKIDRLVQVIMVLGLGGRRR